MAEADYLEGKVNKTYLADYSLSEQTKQTFSTLQKPITNIKDGFKTVSGNVSILEKAIKHLWRILLEEHTLYNFYAQVQRDLITLTDNVTDSEDGVIKKSFARML